MEIQFMKLNFFDILTATQRAQGGHHLSTISLNYSPTLGVLGESQSLSFFQEA